MKRVIIVGLSFLCAACVATRDLNEVQQPSAWTLLDAQAYNEGLLPTNWWTSFNDDDLNQLVAMALEQSPTRNIAEARVFEARGLRRTTRSRLLPNFTINARSGREQSPFTTGPDNFYDATVDASYEIDVFGKNRHASGSASADIAALQAEFHDVTLTLIADVVNAYIDLQSFDEQIAIVKKNFDLQQSTLKLIELQERLGEAPKLDADRGRALVKTTEAVVPEFQRARDRVRLRLSVLTGVLPEVLAPMFADKTAIPQADVSVVAGSPAEVLAKRPDVQAATAFLNARSRQLKATAAEIFPSFSLSGFFGESDNALASSLDIWNAGLMGAFALLDFGRIEGRIDVARAQEAQAFEQYRQTMLSAVADVESAFNDNRLIAKEQSLLQEAYESADSAFHLSKLLYQEGEIAFLDLLDSQRTLNNSEAVWALARANQAKSVVRLYKALGLSPVDKPEV